MSKMNLPNRLTMLRLCLVPVVMAVLLLPEKWLSWKLCLPIGLALFIVTSLTDMLDGKIARARGLITDFGKFMDPVADKFMVIGTFMVLLFRMLYPQYYGVSYNTAFTVVLFVAVLLLIFRELAITSLRLVLVSASGKVVAANMLGKIKTVSQIVCICVLLIEPIIELAVAHFAPNSAYLGIYPLSWATTVIMLVFTLLSGVQYIYLNRAALTKNW